MLLTINTLAQPYTGITHDARLYSVQVLNRVEHGAYADDLFFRYGSQDDYSLFSHLAAPLVRLLGLSAAFFVIYLVSKSLLIYGMMRLVQTLVPNPAAATLALFYCMAFQIHYGGHHMLFVQENFVTPRMLSCALVLIGLDMVLRGRPITSGLAVVFAVGIHPLMGFGGLMVWAGFHLWKYLGVKTFCTASVAVGILAIIVLTNESLGKRCFGEMDDVWRQSIMQASPFNFPSLWDWVDWLGMAFQLAIVAVVIWKYHSLDGDATPSPPTPLPQVARGDRARFLIMLLIVTVAGAFGAIVAEQLPYALLLQGQPYRAMWMLAFVHLAFVVWLCSEWSRQGMVAQLAGCVLLAYLCCINGLLAELALPILLFPLLAVILRGLDKEPQNPDWLIRSIQFSLVLGAIGWGTYKFFLLARGYEELLTRHAEHRDIVEILLRNLGPIVFCAAFCWLAVGVRAPRDAGRRGMRRPPAFALRCKRFATRFRRPTTISKNARNIAAI